MYLDQANAIPSLKEGKILEILRLCASNEGVDMEVLFKIAEIIKSGKKEVVIISEEARKTALGERGLLSLTIGFK